MSKRQRRLAAIMFTDMVGYTALGQQNESLSLALVEEQQKIIRPILRKHNGREVKTMGDAFLVEFPSALDATRCSYAIQRALRELNISLPEQQRIRLRIGIHLGDVVESEGDVSGDAVNLASRIEPLADDGGVCLTRQVYDQVRNKFELPLESLGEKQLKNIVMGTEVFKMVMPWVAELPREEPVIDRYRVAVLPFRSMSQDPNDEYFAEGMTEELITGLSKISRLTVIARTSMMHYKNTAKRVSDISRELRAGTLVEGSVRKAGTKVRVTVQLLNSETEGHIWAENYDRQLDDIFAIQTEIAEKVAKELKVQLGRSERDSLKKSPTEDSEVYMLYLKGRHYWNERSKGGIEKAIAYFGQAVQRDPGFALGYAGLADCFQTLARNRMVEFAPNYVKAKEYARKALKLDDDLAEAHATLGGVLHYYDRDWEGSEKEFKRAIELKPSYATAHQWYSHVLVQQRRFDEAYDEVSTALDLDPFSLAINHNFGGALYFYGRFEEAIDHWKKISQMDPDYSGVYSGPPGIIQAYVQKGENQEALGQVEKFAQISRSHKEIKLWKAYVYASMGRESEARILLSEVEEGYQAEHISAYLVAQVRFILGETDTGFQWLEKAYSDYDGSLDMMAIDFELLRVRTDSRFANILRRIGLGNVYLSNQ